MSLKSLNPESNYLFQRMRPPSAKPLFFRVGFSTTNPGNCYTLEPLEPVIAPGDGTVISVRAIGAAWAVPRDTLVATQPTYEIAIDHGQQLTSKLHGIGTVQIANGQQVTRGQILGYPATGDIFFQTIFQNSIFNPNLLNRHFAIQSGQFTPDAGGFVKPAPDLIPRQFGSEISLLVNGDRYFLNSQNKPGATPSQTGIVLPYLINVAFNGNETKSGFAATGVSNVDFWNNVPAVDLTAHVGTFPCSGTSYSVNPFVPLYDYTDKLTTASMRRLVSSSIASAGTSFDPMLARWEGGWTGSVAVQNEFAVNGLPTGNYLLYLYANQSSGTNTSNFYVSTREQPPALKSVATTAVNAFSQGLDFVAYSLSLPPDDFIKVNSFGYLSGMQIQMVSQGFVQVPTAQINVVANPSQSAVTTGTGNYAVNSQVEIAVAPNPGWLFTGWLDLSNSSNLLARTVTVNSTGATYTAVLIQTAQSALIKVSALPPIAASVSGAGNFAVGSQVTISATPRSGWSFTGWNDGNTYAQRIITVPANGAAYVANFTNVAGSAQLSVTANPVQSGTPIGNGNYPVGSGVSISIVPNPGWVFQSWNDGNTNNARTVFVPGTGAVFAGTLTFVPGTALLAVSSNPPSGGNTTGSGTYPVGTSVQIQAFANSGFIFTGWNDGASQNPRQAVLPASGATYVANFTAVPATAQVAVIASPPQGGIVSGGGTYVVNSLAQVIAVPNSGYAFTGWSDGGAQTHSIAVPSSGITLTANFAVFTGLPAKGNPTALFSFAPLFDNSGPNGSGFIQGNSEISGAALATSDPAGIGTGWYRLQYTGGAISYDSGQHWFVNDKQDGYSFGFVYYGVTSENQTPQQFNQAWQPATAPTPGDVPSNPQAYTTVAEVNNAYGGVYGNNPNAPVFVDFYYVNDPTLISEGIGVVMYLSGPGITSSAVPSNVQFPNYPAGDEGDLQYTACQFTLYRLF